MPLKGQQFSVLSSEVYRSVNINIYMHITQYIFIVWNLYILYSFGTEACKYLLCLQENISIERS